MPGLSNPVAHLPRKQDSARISGFKSLPESALLRQLKVPVPAFLILQFSGWEKTYVLF